MKKFLALAAILATVATGAAHAASPWPPNVVGKWSANANQFSLTLNITSQASSGYCRQIAGTIVDNTDGGATDNLLGVYCPDSGRIAFTRAGVGAASAYQNYTANLSQKSKVEYMGGVFSENATPANVGEYGFYAAKGK